MPIMPLANDIKIQIFVKQFRAVNLNKNVIYKNNTTGYKTNLEAEERQLGIYRGMLMAQETITGILHDSESILRM